MHCVYSISRIWTGGTGVVLEAGGTIGCCGSLQHVLISDNDMCRKIVVEHLYSQGTR